MSDDAEKAAEQIAHFITGDRNLFEHFEKYVKELNIDSKDLSVKDILSKFNKEQRLEWSKRMKQIVYG